MKLKEKTREKGKIHRRYDTPKTPYQRIMESPYIPDTTKNKLRSVYLSLNPAQLKRSIEKKLKKLYKTYQEKITKKRRLIYAKDKNLLRLHFK